MYVCTLHFQQETYFQNHEEAKFDIENVSPATCMLNVYQIVCTTFFGVV